LADKLRHVESQEEYDTYNKYFKGVYSFKNDGFAPLRRLIFYPRMYLTTKLMRWHFNVGFEYNPFREGLEVKYACEAAEDNGAQLKFLGNELNAETRWALYHETRFSWVYFFAQWIRT